MTLSEGVLERAQYGAVVLPLLASPQDLLGVSSETEGAVKHGSQIFALHWPAVDCADRSAGESGDRRAVSHLTRRHRGWGTCSSHRCIG